MNKKTDFYVKFILKYSQMSNRSAFLIGLALFLGGLLSGGVLFNWLMDRKLEQLLTSTTYRGSTPVAHAGYSTKSALPITGTTDFVDAAEKTTESVVFVNTVISAGDGSASGFHNFFGGTEKARATGSGVILSADGYIITNNHVVEQAEMVNITLNDRREFEAKIVARDPNTDLAVLKIDAKGLKPIEFANSDEVKIGQWVLAVGNPFNLTSTVTAGIISAKARNIGILRKSYEYSIESFLQTDAAVNPGNSGGALVNLNGELIGINTAIATETGFYAGYSFAIPSNLVNKVVKDLIDYGVVQRGFIGVNIRDVDAILAREEGLETTEGVYITGVNPNGAAMQAGLKAGDIIQSIDGISTRTSSELQERIVNNHKPGDEIQVQVLREGKEITFRLTLRNQEGKQQLLSSNNPTGIEFSPDGLGATLQSADRKTLAQLGLTGGVAVLRLDANGKFANLGIEEGFIITEINQNPVFSPKELMEALSKAKGKAIIEGFRLNGRKSYFRLENN